MQRTGFVALILAAFALIYTSNPAAAQDGDIAVEDGGISATGWAGSLDPGASGSIEDARLAMHGDDLHVMTGPQVSYWMPENTASGDYTVSATFEEPEYMNLNNHPHPYGLFIGGNDLGTDDASFLYCAAYGNGAFIVRGFGPESFQMNGRRAEEHEAVNEAPGQGQPVTQEIAMSVNGDQVACSINGTVVASYDKSEVVGDGKLKSTDGVYGIRFAHNTEGIVSGLTLSSD